ncbi:MAG: U32 family peptidase [Proteobacteria bacterium]|nr:U32 family peptidase [Pseudomonadota bacterium]MBU1687572.1 U32 family peptidase [Pseudomonadota bacterium]
MIHKTKTTELLAPAGSIETFFAALEAGADAVYCGLKEFSARAKAKNFTTSELTRMAALAHGEGRRIYVTLNTLIKEAELPRLIELLAKLSASRVDGLIIQDPGLWRLAHTHFPELPLHASTQMTIHNGSGVRLLESMGFTRAVLARELTIEEIATISRETSIELEHFIHGALCYSISGHCLFSSWLSGKSGNRGRCQQPCRRRYHDQEKPGFHFSTCDLAALEYIPQLAAAGVMSFKIEGRMKNAEYVFAVVRAYRKVIDAPPESQGQAVAEARELLAESWGRPTTTGFLTNPAPLGVVLPQQKGGIGRPVGRVELVTGKMISFSTATEIHVGDRLRIQPGDDQSGDAFTIREITVGNRSVKRAGKGTLVRIPTPFVGRFSSGDQIYQVASGRSFTMSEEACRRRLAATNPPPLPVDLQIVCGQDHLEVTATVMDITLHRSYPVVMVAAERSPLSPVILEKTFAKTGHDHLTLTRLTAEDLPQVVIKPSHLNEIRRSFYAELAPLVEKEQHELRQARIRTVQNSLIQPQTPPPKERPMLSLIGQNLDDLFLLDKEGVERLILPLTAENIAAVVAEDTLTDRKDKLIWDLPGMIFPGDWSTVREQITRLRENGFQGFRLNNPSHFEFFPDPATLTLIGGFTLPVLNSQAALALKESGLSEVTLSPEDDRANLRDLLGRPLGITMTVIVYSPITLMTSRIPLPTPSPGPELTADSGERLHLDRVAGLTMIRAIEDFSLTGHLQELNGLGCRSFLIDLSGTNGNRERIPTILTAIREDRVLSGTSLFNYERGLE